MYQDTGKCVVDPFFEGISCAIYVYGQTSAGKTHTLIGSKIDDKEEEGIMTRTVRDVFERIGELSEHEASKDTLYSLTVSCLELYDEEFYDLLQCITPGKYGESTDEKRKSAKVKLLSDRDGVPFAQGATEIVAEDLQSTLGILQLAQSSRVVSETRFNATSSRSHFIVTVTLTQRPKMSSASIISTLSFVDLAGAEAAPKVYDSSIEDHVRDTNGSIGSFSEVAETQDRLAKLEISAINRSIMTLGKVIAKLSQKRKARHIPYRDSKLTRFLQHSLGNNCYTIFVLCLSPSTYNRRETRRALEFGEEALCVRNFPSPVIRGTAETVKLSRVQFVIHSAVLSTDFLQKIKNKRQAHLDSSRNLNLYKEVVSKPQLADTSAGKPRSRTDDDDNVDDDEDEDDDSMKDYSDIINITYDDKAEEYGNAKVESQETKDDVCRVIPVDDASAEGASNGHSSDIMNGKEEIENGSRHSHSSSDKKDGVTTETHTIATEDAIAGFSSIMEGIKGEYLKDETSLTKADQDEQFPNSQDKIRDSIQGDVDVKGLSSPQRDRNLSICSRSVAEQVKEIPQFSNGISGEPVEPHDEPISYSDLFTKEPASYNPNYSYITVKLKTNLFGVDLAPLIKDRSNYPVGAVICGIKNESPAHNLLQLNDQLIVVQGVNVVDWPFRQLVELMKQVGKSGSENEPLLITVLREEPGEVHNPSNLLFGSQTQSKYLNNRYGALNGVGYQHESMSLPQDEAETRLHYSTWGHISRSSRRYRTRAGKGCAYVCFSENGKPGKSSHTVSMFMGERFGGARASSIINALKSRSFSTDKSLPCSVSTITAATGRDDIADKDVWTLQNRLQTKLNLESPSNHKNEESKTPSKLQHNSFLETVHMFIIYYDDHMLTQSGLLLLVKIYSKGHGICPLLPKH